MSEIKSPYGEIRSPFADNAETAAPEEVAPVFAPPAPKPKGFWGKAMDVAGDVVMEPLRAGTEAVLAPVNAIKRGVQGYQGLAGMAGAKYAGASWEDAANAGTEAIGQRNDFQSPFGHSLMARGLGAVVQPGVNALRNTKYGEYVDPTLEAVGDISSLFGIKPGLSALRSGARGAVNSLAKTQLPERLYASAAKMPLSKAWTKELGPEGISKRKEAVTAGLQGEVPISEVGIAKAKNLEQTFRQGVDAVVADLDNTGVMIPKEKFKAGLEKAYEVAGIEGSASAERIVNSLYGKRFEKMGQMVKVGEREIPAVYETGSMGERILKGPARVEPIMERQYKPSEVQAIKRHLYKMENYERQKLARGLGSQLKELGNKGMAHEAKVALEELWPDLKRLNRQDAAYINLVDALERAVPRLQNKDMLGIGTKILIAGSHPGLGLLEHLVGLPFVKAKAAFALNRARKMTPAAPIGPDAGRALSASIPAIANPAPSPMPVAAEPESPMWSNEEEWRAAGE